MIDSRVCAFHGTDRFTLVRLLGRGASGAVYEALDREQGRHVALKWLTHLSPASLASFKQEFRSLQHLRHRNLLELFELTVHDGHWFLCMELVRGSDLLSYVRAEPVSTRLGEDVTTGPASPSDDTLRLGIELRAPVPRGNAERARSADEARVRAAFQQLAAGLDALHRAGKVHRDVKPSNVLVDTSERVVLLDFGLVADVDASGVVRSESPAGTPRYMAPEQTEARSVTAASDWYSVGVLLHEALYGHPPAANAVAKPGACGTAEDLSRLCARLLERDPRDRPPGSEILRALGASPKLALDPAPANALQAGTFVGRRDELALLARAFEEMRAHGGRSLVVRGESGVGKTALLKEFARRAKEQDPGVVHFAGRCFEREAVPYKAVDPIIDAVCAYLIGLSPSERDELVSGDASLIAQAFPVMRRLNGEQDTRVEMPERKDPQLQRERIFSAVRSLLGRISRRAPTVITIDDMQWSDLDSLALLSTLVRGADAPRVLLILAERRGGPLERAGLASGLVELSLEKLPARDSDELVTRLLHAHGRSLRDDAARELSREAEGHPLFAQELVRRFGAVRDPAERAPRLQDAIWERIAELEPAAKALITLTATAGKPITQRALGAALAPQDLIGPLAQLRHASLILTTGSHPNDSVETYHDRIREAVLARLEPTERQRAHRSLAEALSSTGTTDAEGLATHWRGAGEPGRARDYAVAAAEQAAAVFSFEQAVRLFELALELEPPDSSERRDLQGRLAAALASAGRGLEAARAYQAAAADDASLLGIDRRRRAGEQLLRSGRIEAGLAVVSDVLVQLGVAPMRGAMLGLLSLLVLRARIGWHGFRHGVRAEPASSELERTRIDGLWTAATCLTLFDNIQSAELQCRATLRALSAGTPLQLVRARTAEAIFLGLGGRSEGRRIDALLEGAAELAEGMDEPNARGWIALSRGVTEFLLGNWLNGETKCAEAEEIFVEQAGAHWELTSARAFGIWSAMMRGEFRRLTARVPGYVEEAERRGDLYGATMQMTGFSNVAWLSLDDVPTARRMIACAEERWPGSSFDVPRYLNMMASAHIELYAGTGPAAHARVLKDWRPLRFGVAFRSQMTRFGMRFMRGLAALAAYDSRPDRSLLHDAAACASAIEREGVVWGGCFAQILVAGVAARRGREEQTLTALSLAEERATLTGMELHRAVMRWRRGELVGGSEGRALIDEARAFMRAQDVVNPDRLVPMLSPACVR